MFMFRVTEGFVFFKGGTDLKFHFIKKCGTERVAQVIVVEMVNVAPKAIIAVAAFRNKTMNMGIPFEISSKGMQNHDKTRSEVSGLIEIKKHPGNNTGNSMKQAMKKKPRSETEKSWRVLAHARGNTPLQ